MKIIIGGDFYPGRNIENLTLNAPKVWWGDILPLISNADLRVVNLESPLTTWRKPISKTGPNLRAHPDTIKILSAGGIDLVTLANNHIFDYGQKGLEDTLNICHKNGIATVGAGLNASESQRTWFCNIKGRTIAIVNFAENEWSCFTDQHGGANGYDLIENSRQIRNAREQADIVLVIIHGGHEYYPFPSPRMIKEYRYFAEQGASAVIGHHTHCVSGFEVYSEVPIFYGLGNLMFNLPSKFPGWCNGMLVELNFDNIGKASWNLISFNQTKPKLGIWVHCEQEKEAFNEQIDEINQIIADPVKLKGCWDEFVKGKVFHYLRFVAIFSRILGRILDKLGLLPIVLKARDLKILHCYILCESHRELLLSILAKWHSSKD